MATTTRNFTTTSNNNNPNPNNTNSSSTTVNPQAPSTFSHNDENRSSAIAPQFTFTTNPSIKSEHQLDSNTYSFHHPIKQHQHLHHIATTANAPTTSKRALGDITNAVRAAVAANKVAPKIRPTAAAATKPRRSVKSTSSGCSGRTRSGRKIVVNNHNAVTQQLTSTQHQRSQHVAGSPMLMTADASNTTNIHHNHAMSFMFNEQSQHVNHKHDGKLGMLHDGDKTMNEDLVDINDEDVDDNEDSDEDDDGTGGTRRLSDALSRTPCGRTRLPPGVVNVDADVKSCLYAPAFTSIIHRRMRERELLFMADSTYMERQYDISTKMRAVLIDWLVDVHCKFRLRPETLYLTVNLIDRYLSMTQVARRKLQLIGVTAMLIASKYEDICAPEVADFVYISDRAYNKKEILECEADMLNRLEFDLTVPYSLGFMRRALRVAVSLAQKLKRRNSSNEPALPDQIASLAAYVTELALPSTVSLCYRPSVVGAAAVVVAMRCQQAWTVVNQQYQKQQRRQHHQQQHQQQQHFVHDDLDDFEEQDAIEEEEDYQFEWDETMRFYCGDIPLAEIVVCAQELKGLLEHESDPQNTNKLSAIKRKYSASKYHHIARDIIPFLDSAQKHMDL